MPPKLLAAVRCLGALLLLLACTWVVEIVALVLLWGPQTLAPYAFFPNQTWDFVAKIRWFGDALFAWAPPLPDRFAGLATDDKLSALAPLLPATLAVALVLGLVGAALCALRSRERGSLRRDVLAWAALGLVVHVAVAIPAFGLEEGLRISRMAFRARSLVIDGMVFATVISIAAAALAYGIAPLFGRSRVVALSGAAAVFLAAFLAAPTGRTSPPPPAGTAAKADPARPRRNVVLISLDSLRADHVGAYGYQRDTSPVFDRVAREGVLFRNAIATSSWTLPTHLTMFTGLSQVAHGVFVDTVVLPRTIPTLGEIFREAGYQTAGFVSGPYVGPHYGYDRGMDTYVDFSAKWGKSAEARSAILSPEINKNALAWLDGMKTDQPFFQVLHYFDIHYDFVPPPPFDAMFDPDYTGTMDGKRFIERDDVHPGMDKRDLDHILALYDGEIRFTDMHVGKILDRLREKNLLDSTVLMILSDHGDEFFEHGNKGHHRTVYDEVLRIPFVIRLPNAENAGRVIEDQVSTLDVFPTLLDGAGITPPSDAEGESLIGWIGGAKSTRDAVYADFYDKRGFNVQVARRTPVEKTIQHFNRINHPKRGPIEYYDLSSDAAESDNRSEQHPGEVASALERMSQWLEDRWRFHRRAELGAGGADSIEIDEETKKRLESLGYVGD
jgi:arylsulfatase A-like enzyme